MQFGFTEAQEMFRTQMQTFVQREIAPGAKERAKLNFVPPEIVQKLAGMGLFELCLPEKYEGQSIDWIMPGIAVEEIAKGDIMAAQLTVHIGIAPSIILNSGIAEEVKEEWLPQFVCGEKRFCMMATEPDCGSDTASMKTRAIREGDVYIINGEKTSVTDGMRADAGYLVAKTDLTAGNG